MTVHAHATVLSVHGRAPRVASDAFIAAGARVIGDVEIGPAASVWYNAVLRAERASIRVGARSNLQDGVAVHVDAGHPVVIGQDVSVGHNAVVHGCTLEDGVLIGMGAVILNGARIGAGSLVAAGAVVLEATHVPEGSLVAGVPGRVRRPLSAEERAGVLRNAQAYLSHSDAHAAGVS